MFVDTITNKVLLYPTNGYHLLKQQFSALINVINLFSQDRSFFVSEIETTAFTKNKNPESYLGEHFEISLDTTYYEYEKINICLENALYSPVGEWGVMISHESHAVLGGSKDFVNSFKQFYPDWKNDQKKFLENFGYWSKIVKTDLSWIQPFIDYVNKK